MPIAITRAIKPNIRSHSVFLVNRIPIPVSTAIANNEKIPRLATHSNPVGRKTGTGGVTVPRPGINTFFSSPVMFHCVLRTGENTTGRAKRGLDSFTVGLPRRKRTSTGTLGSADPGNGIKVASSLWRAVTGWPLTVASQSRTGLSGSFTLSARRPRDLT